MSNRTVFRLIPWPLLFVSVAATLSTSGHAQSSSHPSFDCQKAATRVEKLICSEPTLGDLDRKMAEAFKQVAANAPAANRQAIIDAQLRWLQHRAVGCSLDPHPRQPEVRTLDAAPPAKCLANLYEGWLKYTVLELAAAPRLSQRTQFPFEAKRQPFAPRLLVSQDAKLCDDFQEALRKDFLARHSSNGEHVFKEPPMSLGHWVTWPSDYAYVGLGRQAQTDVAEVDLDQNGQKQLLLHVAQPFNWRGNGYFLLVSPKTAADGLPDQIKDYTEHLPKDRKPTSIRAVEPYTYGGYIYGYASPVKVLAYQGAMYLYLAKDVNFFGGPETRDGTATLQRIHADGSTELRCEMSIAPKAGALPQWRPTDPPDSLSIPEEVVTWLQTIREIQGNEWGGFRHPPRAQQRDRLQRDGRIQRPCAPVGSRGEPTALPTCRGPNAIVDP